MTIPSTLLIFVAGILPALLWLWFWLKEDRLHPEPKRLIALSFLLGMLVIPFAYKGEKAVLEFFPLLPIHDPRLLLLWATIEEMLKFGAAFIGTHIAWKYYDEPIDAIIYLITAALGFAALENALFLHTDLFNFGVLEGLQTSNLRFIGASLLHVLASALVGVTLAFVFYKPIWIRAIVASLGLVLAIGIHTIFNIFLMDSRYSQNSLYVFFSVWVALILLLVIFEKVKRLPPKIR